jgi:hypothetical protein
MTVSATMKGITGSGDPSHFDQNWRAKPLKTGPRILPIAAQRKSRREWATIF